MSTVLAKAEPPDMSTRVPSERVRELLSGTEGAPRDFVALMINEDLASLCTAYLAMEEALRDISNSPQFALSEVGSDRVFLALNDAVKRARTALGDTDK